MASTTLYPPIVDSIAPAFVASSRGKCVLYFSLSKYSSSTSPIESIHISVIKQSSGQNVVNKNDDKENERYRSTGIIILNERPQPVKDKTNLYYVEILNEDIKSGDNIGWTPGWIYKIQIRFSSIPYPKEETIRASVWLNQYASEFSEWSTYCTTKAISEPRITIPILNHFDSDVDIKNSNRIKEYNLSLTTLNIDGMYSNDDESETLYSYRMWLYDNFEKLLEDSDLLYSNQYYTPNQLHYLFKTEFKTGQYKLKISYTTLNKYEETFNFNLIINVLNTDDTDIQLVTAETIESIQDKDFKDSFYHSTCLNFEQEEGLIGMKFYLADKKLYNGNICIRRSDSRTNFQIWEDIKIIVCKNEVVNNLPVFFDKTAESGLWYKYGVQTIDISGNRSKLNIISKPVLRDYEYSYLVGEGGKQLKLKYDNTMNSYTYNYSESKTDTIGGQYPFITRNGNTKYRTIPINGLLSFNMDEAEFFTNDWDLYEYEDIVSAYRLRRKKEHIIDYDYRREFDFREKVLAFLQDGKPKLFKSATEGNLVVRLMNVTGQPNQSLNRMIYSFTSTAHEIADATIDTYIKYGIMDVGTYTTSFAIYSTHIGQIEADFNIGDDLIKKIWDKYNFSNKNIAGIKQTLIKIHHISIHFTDKPLKIKNNANELVIGNNFKLNGNTITVKASNSRTYIFDENVTLTKSDKLILEGGIEHIYDEKGKLINTIHAEVNFLYEITTKPFTDKNIANKIIEKGIGQVYNTYNPGSDIYQDVYYKYYYTWSDQYRVLSEIDWTCIETNPGAVFLIKDFVDSKSTPSIEEMYHEVNQTGILNFDGLGTIVDIKYIGMRQSDGSIDTTQNLDVIIDYIYYSTINIYAEEE